MSTVDYDDGAWRALAACSGRDVDADVFFAPDGGSFSRTRIERAQEVCSACPVTDECLTAGERERDDWSIRGGRTPDQRRRLTAPT